MRIYRRLRITLREKTIHDLFRKKTSSLAMHGGTSPKNFSLMTASRGHPLAGKGSAQRPSILRFSTHRRGKTPSLGIRTTFVGKGWSGNA